MSGIGSLLVIHRLGTEWGSEQTRNPPWSHKPNQRKNYPPKRSQKLGRALIGLFVWKNDQNREKGDRLTTPHIQSPLSQTYNQPNHKLDFITQDTKPGSRNLPPSYFPVRSSYLGTFYGRDQSVELKEPRGSNHSGTIIPVVPVSINRPKT